MATDTEDPEASARATLALLETRLHRLEYLLTGTSHHDNGLEPNRQPLQSKDTARAKLDALEAELGKLKNLSGSAGAVIRDVDQLVSTYPDLFSLSTSASDLSTSEDLSTIASIVLSHATLFPETASRLSSLETLQIPPAEQSRKLVSLMPKLNHCHEEEARLEEEVRELRERSARCLEWWVKVGVIGMGDLWEDWERRITEVERHLIRWERRVKDEQGYP